MKKRPVRDVLKIDEKIEPEATEPLDGLRATDVDTRRFIGGHGIQDFNPQFVAG